MVYLIYQENGRFCFKMKIFIAGKDNTVNMLDAIKRSFITRMCKYRFNWEDISKLNVPAEWKSEYVEALKSKNALSSNRISNFFREFDKKKIDFLPQSIDSSQLINSNSEKEFLETYLKLIRIREHIDSLFFDIPTSNTFIGRLARYVKMFAWFFLRFIVDRIAFRQNLINSNLGYAIEFEHQLLLKELEDLKMRISELEKKLSNKDL